MSGDGEGNWEGGDHGFYYARKGKNKYITYVLWLWRNPTNGLDERVLGLICDGHSVNKRGNLDNNLIKTQAMLLHMGKASLWNAPWEFYSLVRYPGTNRGMRIRIGWKMSRSFENKVSALVQYVFVINPFYKFK